MRRPPYKCSQTCPCFGKGVEDQRGARPQQTRLLLRKKTCRADDASVTVAAEVEGSAKPRLEVGRAEDDRVNPGEVEPAPQVRVFNVAVDDAAARPQLRLNLAGVAVEPDHPFTGPLQLFVSGSPRAAHADHQKVYAAQ